MFTREEDEELFLAVVETLDDGHYEPGDRFFQALADENDWDWEDIRQRYYELMEQPRFKRKKFEQAVQRDSLRTPLAKTPASSVASATRSAQPSAVKSAAPPPSLLTPHNAEVEVQDTLTPITLSFTDDGQEVPLQRVSDFHNPATPLLLF